VKLPRKATRATKASLAIVVAAVAVGLALFISRSYWPSQQSSVGNGNEFTSTTDTSSQQYPVTFLGIPTACPAAVLCVNATLEDHLDQNLSVVLSGVFQDASTGKNATIRGSTDSTAETTCLLVPNTPSNCYLTAYAASVGAYKIILVVRASDGMAVLSPEVTALVDYGTSPLPQ
jgi:hypothetical protein